MTSTASAGERRWSSARRGGMTVLGKVAVPKPLNLPSQRLENHGVDPNVEIVPKGTLSWGNCPSSSSATNAWGSSSADSKANSPRRPSSGGSGTRPSTAGSDRVNESSGSAWGQNSRPSSASGVLSSNQSSLTSLHPHTAEARPASSQLSRFAEPVSDSQGSCGASGTSERLGMVSSKKEDFSLSSRDFPTLGSEKDQSCNIRESKDEMGIAFDRLKIDSSESSGEGLHPSMEKWQAEHQQYFNPNIPPQHFDAWRGPPMNGPSGAWYRGGPQGGPPFGPPVGPGGFPIEPFPYYPPQIPPPAFANSQPVPPPRGGPRGHHPNSGNPYGPKMHDGFMHPGMPYRPGFYPPPMAFESYYRPRRGYHSCNEPDNPFTGANRPVYDSRYPAPNASAPNDSHARSGGHGPAGKNNSGMNFSRSGDTRMPVKFLSRQQAEWDEKAKAKNREHMPPDLAAHPVNSDKNVVKPRKYEWGAEDDGEDDTYPSAHFGGGHNYEKGIDEYRTKKLVSVLTSPLVSAPKELESAYPPTAKDANAKVRSDGRADCFSSGEEQRCGLDPAVSKVHTFPRKPGYAPPMERNSISEAVFSHQVVGPGDDRVVHQTTAPMLRTPYHGMWNRYDHGGKGKFGNQPADGWQRRPVAAEIPNVVSASKVESGLNFIEHGFQQDMGVAEMHQPTDGEGFNKKLQDSTGSQPQRAKMREITKQRALQLQREEDERIKDQKAKALAKLEELNRRTQSVDASDPEAKKSVSSETSKEQPQGNNVELAESVIKVDSPSLTIQLKTEGAHVNDEKKEVVLGSSSASKVLHVEPLKVIDSAKTLPLKHDVVKASIRDGESSYELDGRWNKSTSYKQKQNNEAVKNYNENSLSVYSREERNSPTGTSVKDSEPDVASNEVCSSKQPYSIDTRNNISQSSVEHRRNSRSSKSKNKQDDAALVLTAVATGPTHIVPLETRHKIVVPQAPSLQLSFGSIQVAVDGESGLEMPDQPPLPNAVTQGKVNSQLKPQYTRKMPRVQQVNDKLRADDCAVWAPVRSQNNVDISEEDTAKLDHQQGSESGPSGKSANLAQSSSRSKRAEMERYIPKPVAKELAEQVGTQPILSSIGTSTLDVSSSDQHVGSATVNAGSSVEQGQGLIKHNKSGKTHGAWRQRGSTEFSHVKNIRKIPSDSDTSKSCLEDVSLNQSNPESDQLRAARKNSSMGNDSGFKIASLSSDVPAPETHRVPEDTVITEKGRHYSYKGHKKSGNNDDTNIRNAESDRSLVLLPFRGTNQTDRAITPKENRASSERASSHWQPKAYDHSVSGQKGSRITGNQGDGWEASTDTRKYYQHRGRTSQHNESNDIDESHKELVLERKAEGNHEPRRGSKLSSPKSLNHTTDVDLGLVDGIDVQQVQQFPVGTRRNGNPVNRSGRGHESHGDLPVQGSRQHDRPRHMHYEYQPVGSHDYKKNNFEGQGDGVRYAGSRNKGRGHSHPRRGGGNSRYPRSEHHQLATE